MADEAAAPHAQLQAIRSSGSWRADPVRFRYLEALARRIDAHSDPVRSLLQAKLEQGLADYAARLPQDAAAPLRRIVTRPDASPLGRLNRELREARPDATPGDEELASARRFRKAWDAQRALEKLDLALARKPAQPGPLNSHALVLQSLELMRTLSPQYLRHFVLHVEALQWLAAAAEQLPGEQPKKKKPAKGAKTSRVARRK